MVPHRFTVRPCHLFTFVMIILLSVISGPAMRESAAGTDAAAKARAAEEPAASSAAGEMSTSRALACYDTSRHIARLVPVARGVALEVLDWGGTGEPLVFLTGLGNSAHIFDSFAYHFTDRFRVMGITRRGYGLSSKPATGYDLTTRVADIIKVLDHFRLAKAVFVGHSIAGVELSRLGAAFPDRVSKLVYLDAYDYGPLHSQIPAAPGPGSQAIVRDGYSPQHADAFVVRTMGYRGVTADTCNIAVVSANAHVGAPKTPAAITGAIIEGSGLADFTSITAPTLGIFARPQGIPPYYALLTAGEQAQYDVSTAAAGVWQADVIQRFRTSIGNVQVVELANAAHYLYQSNEAEVVRLMRTFLLSE